MELLPNSDLLPKIGKRIASKDGFSAGVRSLHRRPHPLHALQTGLECHRAAGITTSAGNFLQLIAKDGRSRKRQSGASMDDQRVAYLLMQLRQRTPEEIAMGVLALAPAFTPEMWYALELLRSERSCEVKEKAS